MNIWVFTQPEHIADISAPDQNERPHLIAIARQQPWSVTDYGKWDYGNGPAPDPFS